MKGKHSGLVLLNTVTLIIMLFVNFASNTGVFSQKTVGDVSRRYDTLFAPAGYAFMIWGFLFLLAMGFVIFQWILLRNNDPENFIKRTGLWFSLSNVLNAAWVYMWIQEMLAWCVVLIVLLLTCLIILTIKLRLELDDEPVRTIFFVWWPITFYLGWMMVATIACISAWLVSTGWALAGLEENTWTIIMIIIACFLYLLLIIQRNMREAASVGVWALIAIAVRQWNLHFYISVAAVMAASVLTAAALAHVYKNRYYAIGAKLRRGEWK